MKKKHTPGPWTVEGPAGHGVMIRAENGSYIAVAYGPNVTAESAANAQLMATAPELLKALKYARKCIAYCRKNHPDAQRGEGLPAEVFIDRVIADAEGAE